MKKVKFVMLSLVSVCVLGFGFLLSGCSNDETFTEKTYLSEENQISSITINVEDRNLEIVASDDNQVSIEYFDSEKQYLDITVSESKELTVKLTYNKEWTDFIGTKAAAEYRKIKIGIPNNLISSFSATTTNENIKVSSLSFQESVNLNSNGGNVICERVNVGNSINLISKNGNITGTIIGGWDDFSITCKIKKGDCNLPLNKQGGTKSFSADCNNGDINIEFVK